MNTLRPCQSRRSKVTCTECISASYFTHVPAQISNSRDSAVVYITYLLSYVWLRGRSTQSRRNMFCVIVQDPSSLLRNTYSTRKRHDWKMVHCNVKQWRRALKHLVMFQAFVVQTSISRVTTSVKAGILEPFEQPALCFDKDEWTSKIEYFDPWTFNICLLVPVSIYHLQISGCCIYTALF